MLKITDDEIIRLGNDVAQERNNIAETFNSMTEGQKKEHMHMVDECEMLDFKMYSLRDIILFRQGKINATK